MSQRVKTLFRVFFTLLLLALLAYQMELDKLALVLASASFSLILLAVLVQFLTILLSVVRWRTILGNFEIHTPYGPLARITFIGMFFNLFLPSGIGGDFFRAYYLSKREQRGMSSTLTTTALERSAGLCALLLIGASSASLAEVSIQGIRLFHMFLGLIGLYVLANLALFHPWMHRAIRSFLRRRELEGIETKMELVYEGLVTLRRNKKSVVLSVGVSLLIQFLAVVIVWIAARSISVEAPFQIFLIFVPLINLSIMVPLTINGIGLRESLYYLLFSQIGVPMEVSVGLSLVTYCLYLITALPGVVLYSLYKREEHLDELMAEAGGPEATT